MVSNGSGTMTNFPWLPFPWSLAVSLYLPTYCYSPTPLRHKVYLWLVGTNGCIIWKCHYLCSDSYGRGELTQSWGTPCKDSPTSFLASLIKFVAIVLKIPRTCKAKVDRITRHQGAAVHHYQWWSSRLPDQGSQTNWGQGHWLPQLAAYRTTTISLKPVLSSLLM